MLPQTAIEEFKMIYEKVFKKPIGDAEAERRANKLMELYRAVLLDPPFQSDEVMKSYESGNQNQ